MRPCPMFNIGLIKQLRMQSVQRVSIMAVQSSQVGKLGFFFNRTVEKCGRHSAHTQSQRAGNEISLNSFPYKCRV